MTIDEIINKYKLHQCDYGYSKFQIEEVAKQYAKQEAIAFLDSIRKYEQENKQLIFDDERSSEELYEIYIKEKQ